MTTNNDGWIKMSEQKPTWEDFPIWAFAKDWNHEVHVKLKGDTVHPDITHWQPATLPAPPKKELTQREKDEEAVKALWREHWESKSSSMTDFAVSCIAYRDQQNAEDLEHLPRPGNLMFADDIDHIANLRRRCGLDT